MRDLLCRDMCARSLHITHVLHEIHVPCACFAFIGCPTKHSRRHAYITGHGVVVNIKKIEIPVVCDETTAHDYDCACRPYFCECFLVTSLGILMCVCVCVWC